jgi:Ca2+-binding EF-hand superfamily protein
MINFSLKLFNFSNLIGEKLKVKFINTIDPNSDGRISIDEAQPYLKALNISLDDALVTEIKGFHYKTKFYN